MDLNPNLRKIHVQALEGLEQGLDGAGWHRPLNSQRTTNGEGVLNELYKRGARDMPIEICDQKSILGVGVEKKNMQKTNITKHIETHRFGPTCAFCWRK